MQASDPEATAWARTALVHLGIPLKDIIRDEDYDGKGEVIRTGLKMRHYQASTGWRTPASA
jgi:hypothetical protein